MLGQSLGEQGENRHQGSPDGEAVRHQQTGEDCLFPIAGHNLGPAPVAGPFPPQAGARVGTPTSGFFARAAFRDSPKLPCTLRDGRPRGRAPLIRSFGPPLGQPLTYPPIVLSDGFWGFSGPWGRDDAVVNVAQ